MMFLVLASAFLVAVHGATPDPTKSCLPDLHQVHFTSLSQNSSGVAAFDFPNKIIASRYNNGLRVVFDLNDASLASINETDKSCVKTALPAGIKGLVSQCLPAAAKLLNPEAVHLGLSPDSLDINAWEYDVAGFGTVRLAVTTSSPAVVVLAQRVAADPAASEVQIFTNPSTTITDATIFTVPAVCPVSTVVG